MQKKFKIQEKEFFFYRSLCFWDENQEIEDRLKVKTFLYSPKILDKLSSHIRKVVESHDSGKCHKIWVKLSCPSIFFWL